MKKLVLILFLCITASTFSLDFTQFTLNVNYDGNGTILKAGYSDSTTKYFDVKYEKDLPSFPPPEGIVPGFRILRKYEDLPDELIYTDSDYRETPTENISNVQYQLDILGKREDGKDFYFFVPKGTKSEKVTEVRIIDGITMGDLIDTNIIDGQRFYVKNRFIENFFVKVTYNQDPTSVVEPVTDNSIYYAAGIINISNKIYQKFQLYDLTGNIIKENGYIGNQINIQNLQSGVYFAYIYESDLVIRMLKIIKL
ncbi:MAG: hypothetical protein CVV25_03300 [Ignavibacteriae bacterium HGW-Ignavibacteriae-4]|jgi:hypothetical protein|nr:MAG: hypothetical protein CVV25_03300 [Ignavibacteriae bacterium HGW-Ignavibacteriae-4]